MQETICCQQMKQPRTTAKIYKSYNKLATMLRFNLTTALPFICVFSQIKQQFAVTVSNKLSLAQTSVFQN